MKKPRNNYEQNKSVPKVDDEGRFPSYAEIEIEKLQNHKDKDRT